MKYFVFASLISMLAACSGKDDFDASGNFEADEVIVSAQQNGVLLAYRVREGDRLNIGDTVGRLDVRVIELQKEQAEASIASLGRKTSSGADQAELVRRQIAVLEAQLRHQEKERGRLENLVKADAATRKQLDDMDAGIDQLNRQIAVTRQQLTVNTYNTGLQNRSILSERLPLEKMVGQLQEQINKGQIVNPVAGTVLVNYAMQGEMQIIGRPLYKIAGLDTLDLRAYVTGTQLSAVQLRQQVTVRVDSGKNGYRSYPGTIVWISDKSEFSPKNIQTKDERANLVYALKVRVKNDGYLKIGMYGEVIF